MRPAPTHPSGLAARPRRGGPARHGAARLAGLTPLLLVLLGASCSPPTEEPPMYEPVTARNHGWFPTDHGPEENPRRDCNVCHGDQDSFSGFSCLDCHEHSLAESDARHRGIDGYVGVSSACLQCHPRGEAEALDHEQLFPIAAGSHSDFNCSACHLQAAQGQYQGVSCIDCHTHAEPATGAAHGRVDDYRWVSAGCLTCHPRDLQPGAGHELRFPIAVGTAHGALRCAECHPRSARQDYSAFGCTDCHQHAEQPMAQTHSGVGGYQWTSASCLRCHPQGQAVGVDHEARFPIAAGTHGGLRCDDCHLDASRQDYSSFSCVACHDHADPPTTGQHVRVEGYRYVSADCLTCHPRGASPGAGHETRFPIAAGTAHGTLRCAACHTSAALHDYRPYSCVACHEHDQPTMNAVHGGMTGYEWSTAACRRCHPDGGPASIDHAPFFPIGAGSTHVTLGCQDCHTEGFGSYSCVACHQHDQPTMSTAHATVGDYVWDSPRCRQCHPDGRVMSRAAHDPLFPIVAGRHSRYACADCHAAGRPFSEFLCIECHTGEHTCARMNNQHDEVRNYSCTNASCYRCHPRGVAEDD